MWGLWGTHGENGRPDWVRWMFIGMVVLIIAGLISSRSFGGWWWFFLFPMFWGWGSSRRRRAYRYGEQAAAREKRKNEEFSLDDDAFEKPKRTEFRLGADGELIEVEADEPPLYEQQPPARRMSKSDDHIEYV